MPTEVEQFQAEIERIMWPLWRNGNLVSRRLHTVQDARVYQREVLGIQAELRGVKEKVNRAKQQLLMSFRRAQTQVNPNPLMRLLGARKAAKHAGVMERQLLSEQEQSAVQPYEGVSDYIDMCIQMFDRTKLAIDEVITRGQLR
jgi:hypothetical protein